MMLFMVRPENLSLMTEALGNYESREQLDKESMYGRFDPQVGSSHKNAHFIPVLFLRSKPKLACTYYCILVFSVF